MNPIILTSNHPSTLSLLIYPSYLSLAPNINLRQLVDMPVVQVTLQCRKYNCQQFVKNCNLEEANTQSPISKLSYIKPTSKTSTPLFRNILYQFYNHYLSFVSVFRYLLLFFHDISPARYQIETLLT